MGSEYAVLQYNGYYRQIWTNGLTIVAHLSFQTSKGGRYGFLIRYLSLWGRIGGFTEHFRPHPNEMYLLVIPLHTLWDIVDIRL